MQRIFIYFKFYIFVLYFHISYGMTYKINYIGLRFPELAIVPRDLAYFDAFAMCFSLMFNVYLFQKRLQSSLLSKLGSNFDAHDEQAIESNLLKLDIYYKEFNFQNIVEVPAYSVCMIFCIFAYNIFLLLET